MDEVEAHCGIFVANALHLLVKTARFVVIPCHAETEMTLVLSEFVRGGMVAQPGKFQHEGRLPVSQINQRKGAVGGILSPYFL